MGARLGTTTFGGLGIHVSLLWVLITFLLVSVIVIGYAGQQEHLAKRELPDTDVNGRLTVDGHLVNNYVRFMSEDYSELTISTKTDAQCDTGFTMDAGFIYEAAWLGDAASAIVLPKGKEGDLIVFRLTAQADGGANLTFTTASGENFAAQSIVTATQNEGDKVKVPRTVGTTHIPTVAEAALAGSNALSAHAITTAAATATVWTISATATNNQTNVGAEFSFLCEKDGKWRVGFKGSELGSGEINATFTIA
jgi:Tfp pilus assembly protein PilV